MNTYTSGSANVTIEIDPPVLDGRIERAHELCVESAKTCPNGMIPVQTVYEMMLRLIGREDIVDAMRQEGDDLFAQYFDEDGNERGDDA